jgi:hypothetical protein
MSEATGQRNAAARVRTCSAFADYGVNRVICPKNTDATNQQIID